MNEEKLLAKIKHLQSVIKDKQELLKKKEEVIINLSYEINMAKEYLQFREDCLSDKRGIKIVAWIELGIILILSSLFIIFVQ